MGLLDLDKIIITRTVIGIRCTHCGGNLIVSSQKSTGYRFVQVISLGHIKPETYRCEICKRRYVLF